MPRADQRLYSALLRAGRRFKEERLPLLGVAGTDLVCYNLSWPATLRRRLEAAPPGTGLAEGARLLPQLDVQLQTLLQAEEDTRQVLEEWADLAASFAGLRQSPHISSSRDAASLGKPPGSMPPGLPLAAAAAVAAEAVEGGLALLTQQAQRLEDPLALLEQELGLNQQQEQAQGPDTASNKELAAVSLDELAAAVRQQHPTLFAANSSSGGSSGETSSSGSSTAGRGGSGTVVQQVEAVREVLYHQYRFKYEPFEWVYEGLQPLLLPPQLQRRKLSPLTLAALVAGVGRRLGLPLLPVPAQSDEEIAAGATPGPAPAAAGQGLPLDQLRPDVAQRYAGRSQATPVTGPWVVLVGSSGSSSSEPAASTAAAAKSSSGSSSSNGSSSSSGSSSNSGSGMQHTQQQQQQHAEWPHVLDVCTGEVLGAQAARQKHPALDLSTDWLLHAPLTAWQHMVRTIIQAHQRRGESDAVAHWVYVLLALDAQAPEWDHMLHGSELNVP